MAFGPEGTYGKWIRSHNAIVKINDTIYLHGGISPRYVSMSLKQINDTITAELNDVPASMKPQGPVMGTDSPLWYRGLSQDSGPEIAAHVDKVLAALRRQTDRRQPHGHARRHYPAFRWEGGSDRHGNDRRLWRTPCLSCIGRRRPLCDSPGAEDWNFPPAAPAWWTI